MHVHIPRLRPGEAHLLARLAARLDPAIRLSTGPERPEPADWEGLVTGEADPDLLGASGALRRLIIPWAGIPEEIAAYCRTRPELAVHSLHYNAVPVAEFAVALLLSVARQVAVHDAAIRRGLWGDREPANYGLLLHGRRALMLGYGEIGRRVAATCRAMGKAVTAIRRNPGRSAAGEDIHGPESLHALLPDADVVVASLPGTLQTRGLLDGPALALLPAHAIVVNVGRASLFDEKALFEALRDRRIGGAGLDVWWNYPDDEVNGPPTMPWNLPFETLPNVALSPHRAAFTDRTGELRADHLAAMLNALARGEDVPTVDLDQGY